MVETSPLLRVTFDLEGVGALDALLADQFDGVALGLPVHQRAVHVGLLLEILDLLGAPARILLP